jgi:hypothetical protein
MGWLVWSIETSLCAMAAYLAAIAIFRDRGVLDRAIAALLIAPALLLIDLQLCGLVGHLAPIPLAVVGLLLFGGVGVVAFRRVGARAVGATVRSDVGAPVRLLRDALREREIALVVVVVTIVALVTVGQMVWYFASWVWDPIWYHVPITSYAIQERSIGWIDTHNVYVQGYPRNMELLAVWNCVFSHDNRFDDASQLPGALLGMFVVAAWARRLSASRPLAAALGATWFVLPPIFLQAHSAFVDVACGALFSAAVYFASEPIARRARWMAAIAMGIYLGSKYTGVLHLALMAPWLVIRAVLEVRRMPRGRLLRALDVALSIGAIAALGIHKYVQNYLHTKNPFWPFVQKIPFTSKVLPGNQELAYLFAEPAGTNSTFFGTPGSFERMVHSWYAPPGVLIPDVKSGGFGPVFAALLVPCILIVAADAVRLREWRRTFPLVALFAMSIVVPSAWWPRFIIGAATAGLVAFAYVHGQLPSRVGKLAMSAALVLFAWKGHRDVQGGYLIRDTRLPEARRASATLRPLLQVSSWRWPTTWAVARERELRAGDVIAYDEAAYFLADFFSVDYRTKVRFVSSAGEPDDYLRRLRAAHARWVGVTRGTPAEGRVRAAGGTFLFVAPDSPEAVWRMPAGWDSAP